VGQKKRRTHENRYADALAPQDVLDFHEFGLINGQTVKRETERFIRRARSRGYTCVCIVTGKGRRSRGRPLVAPQVKRTLQTLKADGQLRSVQPERLDRGGEGALRIEL